MNRPGPGTAAKRDEGRDKLDGGGAFFVLAGCAGLGRLLRAGAGLLLRCGLAEGGCGERGSAFPFADAGAGKRSSAATSDKAKSQSTPCTAEDGSRTAVSQPSRITASRCRSSRARPTAFERGQRRAMAATSMLEP